MSQGATRVELGRITHVTERTSAYDGDDREDLLAPTVLGNLRHLWEYGGRERATKPGRRPGTVLIRSRFIRATRATDRAPLLPDLIRSRGLQLRLELLMLFDAQCRHSPGERVRNVRNVTEHPDDAYPPWRQLVLAPGHNQAAHRAVQISQALRALEDRYLVKLGREPGGLRRRYSDLRLLSEASSPGEHPRYTVPKDGVKIDRHFFTQGWVFALTDTEIACYLALAYQRGQFPGRHDARGVFITNQDREGLFHATRTTWRSGDLLHRFGLIDRMPDQGRNFRTGAVGDFAEKWKAGKVKPTRFKINDAALQQPALKTITRVLTAPTEADQLRRHGLEPLSELPSSTTR